MGDAYEQPQLVLRLAMEAEFSLGNDCMYKYIIKF
jgi:hypothetical protein